MLDPWLHQQAVDYHLDGVILALVEREVVIKINDFAIHAGASVAVLEQRFHFFLELALAAADDWGEHHDAILGREGHYALNNLLGGLAADRPATLGTMRNANGGEQQAKIIVDFGDGANGRARAAAGSLLLDRDGRAKPINCIDIRALHLIQKLARVSGKRLHVAALPLGVNRVECER